MSRIRKTAAALCASVMLMSALAQELGGARPNVHEASLEELIANPSFFDGQPVRVIGVADLGVGFEEFPKLYFSSEALENRTYQYLDVEFDDWWIEKHAEALALMKGK